MVSNITILVVSNICSDSWVLEFVVSNITILVVSNICSDSWVLEFVVSNITCNNKCENCIDLPTMIDEIYVGTTKLLNSAP
jgi:hypothetical protein